MTRTIQPVVLPVVKIAEQTGSVKDSFASSWAKALQAGSGVSVPVSASPAKSDAGAAKKAVKTADKEDKPDEANELAQTVDEEASEPSKTAAAVAALKPGKVLVAPELKKTVSVGTTNAGETKKQKAADLNAEEPVTEMKPQVDAPVVLPVVAAPAVVTSPPAAVAQSDAPVASAKGNGNRVATTQSAAMKRERPITNGDGNGITAKAGDAEDAKALPVTEMKAKSFEANAAAGLASHVAAPAAAETNGGVVQGLLATIAPGLTHKSASAESNRASSDLQGASAGTGGVDVNAVQALAAGPGQLEVGVMDGTHGWLKIRAELGTDGQVNALLTSNASAHDALRDAVPALAGYLDSESVSVSRIAVHQAPASAGAGSDMTNGNGPAERDGSGYQEPGYQDSGKGGAVGSASTLGVPEQDEDGMSSLADVSAAVFGAGSGYSGDGIGSWLSVTA